MEYLNFLLKIIEDIFLNYKDIYIIYVLSQLIIMYLVLSVLRILFILIKNKYLATVGKPYQSDFESKNKILIIGDSTAVGTGADDIRKTIGGMLAKDFPKVQIINKGVNGSTILDLPNQIKKVEGVKFNLIIISAGGNDAWRLSTKNKMQLSLHKTLMKAIEMSDNHVIILVNKNVSQGPFPKFIKSILTNRTLKVIDAIESVAHVFKIPVIGILLNDYDNPFLYQSSELLASDGIHPSSRGYEVWYHRMWREMSKYGIRFDHDNN